MADKERYIAACGLPEMMVLACNALDLYLPVRSVEHSDLENLRPEGWIISAEIFVAHLDFLLPYKKHILVWMTADVSVSYVDTAVATISLRNSEEQWRAAFEHMKNAGAPFDAQLLSTPLSPREKDVLRHIAQGLTAKEIAERLGISTNTVVTHRKNISTKLGIRSASGLSLFAMMNGLI